MSGRSASRSVLLASAIVSWLVLGGLTPAVADTGNQDAIEAIAEVTPEVLTKTASASASDGELVAEGSFATVTIPADSSEPILVEGEVSISITLPAEGDAPRAFDEQSSAAVVDHGNGATSVPVVHEDGSLQIATVITDQSLARYVLATARFLESSHEPIDLIFSQLQCSTDGADCIS